jgi:uncharacterized membrane protein
VADVEVSAVVAAPIEAVFAYYAQYDRHGEWQPELIHAELTGGGPVGPGTRGLEVRRLGRRELTSPYEITEHDPPRRSAFRTLAGPIRPSGVATFEPAGDGTRMTFALDVNARGPLRLLTPVIARGLGRRSREQLRRFEERVEAGG